MKQVIFFCLWVSAMLIAQLPELNAGVWPEPENIDLNPPEQYA